MATGLPLATLLSNPSRKPSWPRKVNSNRILLGHLQGQGPAFPPNLAACLKAPGSLQGSGRRS